MKQDLLDSLNRLSEKSNEQWLDSLEQRKLAELEFHDHQRTNDADASDQNKMFYKITHRSTEFIREWIRNYAPGRAFLDYACGNGPCTMMAAESGAELAVGIDISRISIENARREAATRGLANTFFVQADCENTTFPANSFDTVLCSGMLHHLDLSYAIPEIKRILKPGGRCLAVEALNYNPAIKAYRLLTPDLRTEWEKRHILSFADVKFIRRFMDVENVRYWHLFDLLAVPLRKFSFFGRALSVTGALDRIAFHTPLRFMAWVFTFEMVRRDS